MKVKDFISYMQNASIGLEDKEIEIEAPNGLMFEPRIYFKPKDPYLLTLHDPERIESVVIAIKEI